MDKHCWFVKNLDYHFKEKEILVEQWCHIDSYFGFSTHYEKGQNQLEILIQKYQNGTKSFKNKPTSLRHPKVEKYLIVPAF
jgi:hypothetical protein